MIAKALAKLAVSISELHVDPDNIRKHDDQNLAAIKASLQQFGQVKPVVATKDGRVIAGNGTLAAAQELGWQKLAAVYVDMDDDNARAYAIADNRTSDLSWFDTKELAAQLRSLADSFDNLPATGFTLDNLEDLESALWPEASEVDPHAIPDHDPNADTTVIKVVNVKQDDVQDILTKVNDALDGTAYSAQAF